VTYQLKKDVERLSEIQSRIARSTEENAGVRACLDKAYTGINQAILALEKVQELLSK
jgi:hypothetical protein